jgi:hypothetical protein
MKLREIVTVFSILVLGLQAACRSGEVSPESAVVEVVATDFAFQAPDSIPAGWTTLRLRNQGAQTHFVVLDHLPDGRTLDDFAAAAGMAFDSVWNGLQRGTLEKADVAPLLGNLLPEWFAEVRQTGGVGLLAPGEQATATMQLEPGTYILECYVKAPDGTFHTALGMARQLTVSERQSAAGPPTAEFEVTFADGAMTAPAAIAAGRQTVAVHYRLAAEVLLANDVHVARLPEGIDADSVVPWMDWMNVAGLRAPAPVSFLGGVQEMPAGSTAYFTVELTPGRYIWISENAGNGMVQTFTVNDAAGSDPEQS